MSSTTTKPSVNWEVAFKWKRESWLVDQCNRYDQFFFCYRAVNVEVNKYFLDGLTTLVYVVGIVNTILSLIFIFQKKYNSTLLATQLRCFHISNFIVAVFGLISFIISFSRPKENEDMPLGQFLGYLFLDASWNIFLMMSNGMIAIMAVMRLVYTQNPNLATNPLLHYKIIAYAFMVILFLLDVGVHVGFFQKKSFTDYIRIKCGLLLFFVVVAIGCNTVAIRMRTRKSAEGKQRQNSLASRRYKYIAISTVLFVVTTLPYAILNLINHIDIDSSDLNCDFCSSIAMINKWFLVIFYSNCFLDNFLYCILSHTYRRELGIVLKNICGCDCSASYPRGGSRVTYPSTVSIKSEQVKK